MQNGHHQHTHTTKQKHSSNLMFHKQKLKMFNVFHLYISKQYFIGSVEFTILILCLLNLLRHIFGYYGQQSQRIYIFWKRVMHSLPFSNGIQMNSSLFIAKIYQFRYDANRNIQANMLNVTCMHNIFEFVNFFLIFFFIVQRTFSHISNNMVCFNGSLMHNPFGKFSMDSNHNRNISSKNYG